MRLLKVILGDIRFQIKYGFYFLYGFLTLLYIFILSFLHGEVKALVGDFLILSDPMTMGMFFMGALVLLEKSQRVIDSIAISPISNEEYILGKIISISLLSTAVGILIAMVKGSPNLLLTSLGIFWGAIIFSLLGLAISSNIQSLNQYLAASIPVQLLAFLPIIAFVFGFNHIFITYQPGTIIYIFLKNKTASIPFGVLILSLVTIVLFKITQYSIGKMFTRLGGMKL